MTHYLNVTLLLSLLLIAMSSSADAAVLPTEDPISGWNTHAPETAVLLEDQDSEVYTVVDQMPEIVGGTAELYKIIRYPRAALSQGIEGRVYLQFIVDENGNVEDPTVLRDIGGGCGEAAIDAVKEVTFEPGIHQGNRVKVLFTLPITFRLDR